MTPDEVIEDLKRMAEQYRCPWGDPGSNPDYFDEDDQKTIEEAIRLLRKLK